MALLIDQLRAMADRHPDETAYLDLLRNEALTFARWDDEANRLARHLVSVGVRPGDRVALLLDSSWAARWMVSYSAIHIAGAVAVPVNTRLTGREIATILTHARPVLALTSTVLASLLPPIDRVLELDDDVVWLGALGDAAPRIEAPVTDDDLADLMYTSGTTSLPKGVAVRHRNAHTIGNTEPSWTGQSWIHASPLFTFAGISFIYNPMKMGMRGIFMSRFDAGSWLRAVAEHRPSMAFLVPSMVQLVADHPDFHTADLSSLQMVSIGSAPLPPALHLRLADRLPETAVSNSYSMTEAGTAFTFLPPGEIRRRPGSVGQVMAPSEIRIADPDRPAGDVTELAVGEIGEVLIKVGEHHREYYLDPEATARTWHGEWLSSGDLGRMDEDGYLYIVGRSKDVIIRGGNNVHATDVESVLFEHPAIADVAVVGVPHTVLGEDVGAAVVARPGFEVTAADIDAFCVDRLADYKRPRTIWFVDELPRNAMGKVLKSKIQPPG